MLKSFSSYPSKNMYVIISGLMGNLLEAFDVMICVFLSQIIAETFFPPADNINKFFYIFNIFFVGHLARPIGSVLISLYADQLGRKRTLITSIIIIGVCTSAIGFIPGYKTIGILACILFLVFRILQNVSLGGEYIASVAYLIEHGNQSKSGFYGCWVAFGFNSGTLLASASAFTITSLISLGTIPEWSWRIIFMLSLVGTLFGVWMRFSIPESIGFMLENASTPKIKKSEIFKNSIQFIKTYYVQSLAVFAITWLGVCATYSIFIYSPIHLITIHQMTQYTSLGINSISLTLLIILIPIFGILSDHLNRINLLIVSCTFIFILSFPYFWYLSYGSYYEILSIKLILSILCACYFSIAPVVITEIFPLKIRCTSISLIYQTASSLAAGLTPIIMLYLASKTNTAHSPFLMLMMSSLLGFIALYFLKTKPIKQVLSIKANEDNSNVTFLKQKT
jgi:MHS family proline/betaine transporter-like MFS transporter